MVGLDLKRIHSLLSLRSFSIFNRNQHQGVMRNHSSLIHHFNASCRVARKLPALMSSRLLIMMGDFDVLTREARYTGIIPTLYSFIRLPFVIMVSIITLLPHFIQEILVLPFVYTIITMIISISFLSIGYLLIVVWMVLSIVFVLGIARDVKMLKIENNNDIDASELKQLENERKMKTYYRNMTEGFDDIDHRNANAMTKKAYNANPLSLVSSRSKSIWLSSKYNKMNMKKMFTTNYNDKGGNSSLDATIESLKSKAKTKKSKYIEHSHKNHKKNSIIPGVVSGGLGSINNSVISSDVDKDYNSWSSMDEIPSQPVRIKVKQHRKNKVCLK